MPSPALTVGVPQILHFRISTFGGPIETAVREAAGKPIGVITEADYMSVKQLEFGGRDFEWFRKGMDLDWGSRKEELQDRVEWLGRLKNLRNVKFQGCKFSEAFWESVRSTLGVRPITQLCINDCEGVDLGALSLNEMFCTNLNTLITAELQGDGITDLNWLAPASNLEILLLGNNQITDLRPLSTLKKLRLLFLDNNKITDLTPLAGLKKLRIISLEMNPDLSEAEVAKLVKIRPKIKTSADCSYDSLPMKGYGREGLLRQEFTGSLHQRLLWRWLRNQDWLEL